jgi:PKHD-type hydroxylase
MSIYNFSPSHNLNFCDTYATWNDGFTDDELNKLIKICEMRNPSKATIGDKDADSDFSEIRESEARWIPLQNDTTWIYDRFAFIVRQLNGQFFNFDISGFVEDFQYTTYYGDKKGHYDWHVDMGNNLNSSPRKLSLVMQLSDPDEYEGGDFEMFDLTEYPNAQEVRAQGSTIFLPSFVPHQAHPVTKGKRYSLAVWFEGPKWV